MLKKIFISFLLVLTTISCICHAQTLFYSSFEENEKIKAFENQYINSENVINSNKMLPSVKEVFGSKEYITYEHIYNLIDTDVRTKFLTGDSFPITINYRLDKPRKIKDYSLSSANDYPERDPVDWALEGSNDGEKWINLHSVKGEKFTERFQKKTYGINNNSEFVLYRLVVSKKVSHNKDDLLQIADFDITLENQEATSNNKGMASVISRGPLVSWVNFNNKGWIGDKALMVAGVHQGNDSTTGYSTNKLFENLNIPVTENTAFSYFIFPDFNGEYDFNHPGMFTIADIKFTDGTVLSKLSAVDQDGFEFNGNTQGISRRLVTKQWNFIKIRLGEVAKGKIISDILVSYERKNKPIDLDLNFVTFFDDIKIFEEEIIPKKSLAEYAIINRGTNNTSSFSRGLCVPATTMPHGFNFWAASNTAGNIDLHAYQPGNKINHFMISHQASRHLADHGQLMFMPNSSINYTKINTENVNVNARACDFDRETEIANPHYYSLTLADNSPAGNVKVEIAPTDHAGIIKFTFPEKSQNVNVIFDLVSTFSNTDGKINFSNDGSVHGFVDQTTWATLGARRMYFYGTFDKTPVKANILSERKPYGVVSFASGTTEINMKLATSYINLEQAKKNLEFEISESDNLEIVKSKAEKAWNDIFQIAKIENATPEQLTTFYSCMYRLYAYPTNISENIGTKEKPVMATASPYLGSFTEPKIVENQMYTSNGFWDTYRTAWAAYALLTPKKAGSLLDGIVEHYNQAGWIGKWLNPAAMDCMVGTSSDGIFVDAYLKGIKFNINGAFESALKNGSVYGEGVFGRPSMNEVVYDGLGRGIGFSWVIENAINDNAIAEMAKGLKKEDEYIYFKGKSLNYTNSFNKDSNWFMSFNQDGSWKNFDNFDPYYWHEGFVESNAFGMCVSAVHDWKGMANLYGGIGSMAKKIDEIFAADEHFVYPHLQHEMLEAREIGLGQYQHNNQPAHHIPYMYNCVGQPYKTQKITRDILKRLYIGSEIGQGYAGDEDNGEQSGWYILSSLGFYPLDQSSGNYAITSPLFDKITLNLETGKLVIEAKNNSSENIYIQSLTIDGKPYKDSFISHKELIKAKRIVFEMGNRPSDWGVNSVYKSVNMSEEILRGNQDFTIKDCVFLDDLPLEVTSHSLVAKIWNNPKALFDNNSATAASFPENKASIYYAFPEAQKIDLYTVTSSRDILKSPQKIIIWGSMTGDNNSWVKIDERKNIDFKWAQYVKPFAVNNQKEYKFYRMDFEGNKQLEISEIEIGTRGIF